MVLVVACVFIAMDMVTGLVKALKNKKYKSSAMREGLLHKCGSLLCVAFGFLLEYAETLVDLGFHIPFTFAICAYIIIMETGSITENLCAINPEIMPEKLKSYLIRLSEDEQIKKKTTKKGK